MYIVYHIVDFKIYICKIHKIHNRRNNYRKSFAPVVSW